VFLIYYQYQEYQKVQENYGKEDQKVNQDQKEAILGMTVAVFMTVLLIVMALWITALVLLVNNWNKLQDWAKVLGVIGVLPMLPGGPLLTIIVVLCGRQSV